MNSMIITKKMKKKILSIGAIAVCVLIFTTLFSSVLSQDIKTETFEMDSSFKSNITSEKLKKIPSVSKESIDVNFVYNITAKLSNIIFDVYNEEEGELAKGRAFGTKGEHKAAEILYENMSQLGLYTIMEQLRDIPGSDIDIVSNLEVIDYDVRLNNESIECYIAPSWKGLHDYEEQLNCTFSNKDLKIYHIPRFPYVYNQTLADSKHDFVFIGKDLWNDPYAKLPVLDLFKPIFDPLKFYILFHLTNLIKIKEQTELWYKFYPNCKGLVLYDFNKDCHDMIYFPEYYPNSLPVIFINGSIGSKITGDIDNYFFNFNLEQQYNTSVVSYNIIGQLNGTKNPNKTVIIGCLYDSFWCQGTADSAIGMGIVLGIAKYFNDYNIKPKYTIKFIGFSGEEYDIRGAKYYETIHKEEDIIYFIDLNQLGFTQNEPRLALDVISNKLSFLNEVGGIVDQSNYVERTGDVADVKKILWKFGGIPSDVLPFSINRPDCNSVCFLKDGGWILHHRDGMGHTEGDVLKYFNWTDTSVTGEIILNLTKHIVLDNFDYFAYDNFLLKF